MFKKIPYIILVILNLETNVTANENHLNSKDLESSPGHFCKKINSIIETAIKEEVIGEPNEDTFHCLISKAYLWSESEQNHTVSSEVKAGRGFGDNIFYPRDKKSDTAIIHEYKYANRNEDHNAKLESGFLQIYGKNYMQYIVDKTQKDGKANRIINRSIVFYEDDSKEIKVEAKQTEHEIKVAKDIVEFFNKHPSVLCLIEGKPKDFLEKIKYNSLDNWLKAANNNSNDQINDMLNKPNQYNCNIVKEFYEQLNKNDNLISLEKEIKKVKQEMKVLKKKEEKSSLTQSQEKKSIGNARVQKSYDSDEEEKKKSKSEEDITEDVAGWYEQDLLTTDTQTYEQLNNIIKFSKENFKILLEALQNKGYTKGRITSMAGYSYETNATRDFENMLRKSEQKQHWDNIATSLEKKGSNINYFFK